MRTVQLAVALLCLTAATTAQAHRGNGQVPVQAPAKWRHLMARSTLPTPATLQVVHQPRRGAVLAESFDSGEVLVHGWMSAAAIMHEVGHVFDLQLMDPGEEQRFAVKVLGEQPGVDWWADTNAFGTPLAEEFAEVYSVLARHARCRADELDCFDNEGYLLRDLSRRQIATARVLIRRFAREGGWMVRPAL